MKEAHKRFDKIEGRLDTMDAKFRKVNNELDKLNSQTSSLRSGQIDIRKEIKAVDIKLSETYQLALDAWGTNTENREWLKSATQVTIS